ncbi:MAG: type I-U CRISPR-associated protein Cas7, partial [Thermoanaerobaculum sp.]
GLALLAFTAFPEPNLREGCELVLDPERPPRWEEVSWDGHRDLISVTHEAALAYAQVAAEAFGVSPENITAEFNPEKVVQALKKTKEERKKSE